MLFRSNGDFTANAAICRAFLLELPALLWRDTMQSIARRRLPITRAIRLPLMAVSYCRRAARILLSSNFSLLTSVFLLVTGHWSLVTLLPAQSIITTVAGTTWTFRGDGGPATNAPLGEV